MEKLHSLASLAAENDRSLKEVVLADEEIGPLFTEEGLAPLDHPEQYIGHAVEIVDKTIAIIRQQRQDAAGCTIEEGRKELSVDTLLAG
ncbi:MAG: hypothetical protein D3906_15425 [Candidatus Electrothrix sp. AUS1_2]|nr:hypothetical protein [Candidatus Electrothrix sp. AUS1_2]